MLKGHIGKCYTLLKNTFLKLCIGMVVRFLLVVKKKPFQGPINFFQKTKGNHRQKCSCRGTTVLNNLVDGTCNKAQNITHLLLSRFISFSTASPH